MITKILEYLGIVLIFINACLYIKSYINNRNVVALKYFSLYLSVSFIVLTTTIVLGSLRINNLYLSHFYFLTQFVLISLFYKSIFREHQKRWIDLTIALILTILAIQYITKPGLFFKFNILEIFLSSFPLIVFSVIHLYNSLSEKGQFMYINAGILIYLTTSTLIFILGDYLSNYENSKAIKQIWLINKVLYIIYLALILLEWKNRFLLIKRR